MELGLLKMNGNITMPCCSKYKSLSQAFLDRR
jgi:hypothetical protein